MCQEKADEEEPAKKRAKSENAPLLQQPQPQQQQKQQQQKHQQQQAQAQVNLSDFLAMRYIRGTTQISGTPRHSISGTRGFECGGRMERPVHFFWPAATHAVAAPELRVDSANYKIVITCLL